MADIQNEVPHIGQVNLDLLPARIIRALADNHGVEPFIQGLAHEILGHEHREDHPLDLDGSVEQLPIPFLQ